MLSHLLSPMRIGTLEIRNRIAVAPMGVEIAEADGQVREPVLAYYEAQARGGAGLIITENTSATYPRGANSAHELGVSDDCFLPGLSALTERVHACGGKIAIQLAHHGKVGRLDTQEGRELLMPSVPQRTSRPQAPPHLSVEEMKAMAKAAGGGRPVIREATTADLEELAVNFADAADRAKRAGFDGIELHGAHGYIFSEFLSRAWNHREDPYGGSIENRSRLLCEVLRACKQVVGSNFPVWCRIDAVEFGEPEGIRIEDACRTAELLEAAGADAIHVSAYAPPLGAGFTKGPIVHQEGGYVELASAIKKQVSIPIIAVGRISPELGDRLIAQGKADIIAMGRQILADPDTPRKLIENRGESIRPCVYCYTCVAQAFFDRSVRCAVNPVTANEATLLPVLEQPARRSLRVWVIGGGPAGMEAARVAALRGHQVTLYEKGVQLGGTLRFAALVYEPNERLLKWLIHEVKSKGVLIRLRHAFAIEDVKDKEVDHIILAMGAVRESSPIPGADLPHVLDGESLRNLLTGENAESAGHKLGWMDRLLVGTARRLGFLDNPARLRGLSSLYMPIGKKVVIVGGGLVGVELAEFLVHRGRKVIVLEAGNIFAAQMAHPRRWRALFDASEAGVELIGTARVEAIEPHRVLYRSSEGEGLDEPKEILADQVILTTGLVQNPVFSEELRRFQITVDVIGDATGVGYIEGAIHDGFRAGLAVGNG